MSSAPRRYVFDAAVDAARDRVFAAIVDEVGTWPAWFPGVMSETVAAVPAPRAGGYASGSVRTKPTPPSNSASAMPSTMILSGRQSRRSEIPAKNSTAAKKTVERM